MEIISSNTELHAVILDLKKQGTSIGFVPTMGALHDGHLALLRQSREQNDRSVCSIFVNPTQFNNPEDLKAYPRMLEKDLPLLEKHGCDYVFVPEVSEMYPAGEPEIKFNLGHLEKIMEGEYRPGHFQGVATIVKKLFDVVMPDKAYFGKKDYQQLMVIQLLVKLTRMNIKIIACETVREKDGLAISSRNLRLRTEERAVASFIYSTLCKTREMVHTKTIDELITWAKEEFGKQAMFRLEYFEIADAKTLEPIQKTGGERSIIACVAAYLGDVRLIDNMVLIP